MGECRRTRFPRASSFALNKFTIVRSGNLRPFPPAQLSNHLQTVLPVWDGRRRRVRASLFALRVSKPLSLLLPLCVIRSSTLH